MKMPPVAIYIQYNFQAVIHYSQSHLIKIIIQKYS